MIKVTKAWRWGVLWNSKNKMDGERKYIKWNGGDPLTFFTKKAAMAYIKEHYGYIAKRKDLRGEPHGWRIPKAVEVVVSVKVVNG